MAHNSWALPPLRFGWQRGPKRKPKKHQNIWCLFSSLLCHHCLCAAGAAGPICISDVEDTEESIWAPKYGIKGQIDATLTILTASSGTVPQLLHTCHPGGREGVGDPQIVHRLQPDDFAGARAPSDISNLVSPNRTSGQSALRSSSFPRRNERWSENTGRSSATAIGVTRSGAKAQPREGAVGESGIIAPLEFKTGKEFYTHAAQVELLHLEAPAPWYRLLCMFLALQILSFDIRTHSCKACKPKLTVSG